MLNHSEEQCGRAGTDLATAWLGVCTLLIPLFLYVLFVGCQQCSSKTSASSNSDVFTLNIIVMEISNIVGMSLYSAGSYSENILIILIGQSVIILALTGQTVFHNLICVDRYLAVVHPIHYLHLKSSRGVKVRNISSGCVWAACIFLPIVLYFIGSDVITMVYIMVLPVVSIIFVCFCTAAVLFVLIRPQPGEEGRDRKPVDQSKRMAFYTMLATLCTLLSKFTVIVSTSIIYFVTVDIETKCLMAVLGHWFSIPSSFMLPLLFLRRAGKLPKWKRTLITFYCSKSSPNKIMMLHI